MKLQTTRNTIFLRSPQMYDYYSSNCKFFSIIFFEIGYKSIC